MSPCAAAEASVRVTAEPETATFATDTPEPAARTVNAPAAGTESWSSPSSYASTSVASVIAAERRAGAVVSAGAGVSLVHSRLLTFAAALPARSRIGLAEGAK